MAFSMRITASLFHPLAARLRFFSAKVTICVLLGCPLTRAVRDPSLWVVMLVFDAEAAPAQRAQEIGRNS